MKVKHVAHNKIACFVILTMTVNLVLFCHAYLFTAAPALASFGGLTTNINAYVRVESDNGQSCENTQSGYTNKFSASASSSRSPKQGNPNQSLLCCYGKIVALQINSFDLYSLKNSIFYATSSVEMPHNSPSIFFVTDSHDPPVSSADLSKILMKRE